jgi:tetratricopeptide (TPR) repeat protein
VIGMPIVPPAVMRQPGLLIACLALLVPGPAQAVPPPPVKWSQDAYRWAPAFLKVVDRHRDRRPVRLRVYAESDYAATAPRWQERMRGVIDDVNILVGPTFGVRFEVESFRRWEGAPRGSSTDKALDLLATKDPAEDVDWVLGLMAPLPLLSSSMHEIGMARELGRHFVMRGMADSETDFLKPLDLSKKEEQQLATARRWHKEISVFLHEWGHTLGAIHSSDEGNLMNPTYSHNGHSFWKEQLTAMDLALECRLGQPPRPAWRCQPLLAYLEKTNTRDWFTEARQDNLRMLREGLKGEDTSGPALTTEQAKAWNTALALVEESRTAHKGGDLTAAMRAAAEAADQARTLRESGGPIWLSIARQYHSLGAISRAEEALAHAGNDEDAKAALAALQRSRRTYGLPWWKTIPADAEPGYVRAFDSLAAALTPATANNLAKLMETYPQAPGLLMLECEVHLRAGRARQADQSCGAALQAAPELARAHYLLGLLDTRRDRAETAVTHLRKAIDLDPESAHHWESLGALYRVKANRAELRALADDYTKRFGRKLP